MSFDPVASLSKVTFRYADTPGGWPVVEDISLVIPQDDFLGLIGPNGGGKTTLLKILLGLVKPQKGTVRVLGRPPGEVNRRIGYVPQHAKIDSDVPATVFDVVLTGRLGSVPWGFRYGKAAREAAGAAMDRVGVAELKDRRIGDLSGGQRQRVLIARALAAEVKILFLDEPMAGVDIHMEKGILDLLHRLNRRMPIVLVSHDLGFISTHVKRVACLNRTMVVHQPGEITRDIIDRMYDGHGSVHQIHHTHDCPIEREGEDH